MDNSILEDYEDTPKKGHAESEEDSFPDSGLLDDSELGSVSDELGLTEGPDPRDEDPDVEYDEDAVASSLQAYADEAAQYKAKTKWDNLTEKINRLPARMPSEEQLARMSETDRINVSRAISYRDQLVMMRDQILPREFQNERRNNQMMADSIINNQKRVRQVYPSHWHKIIDRVRQWHDESDELKAEHLANWGTFELAAKTVIAEEYMAKQGRTKLRGVAAQGALAGRGGAGVSREDRGSNVGRHPRDMEDTLSRVFDGDRNLVRRVMRRTYGE